ncbi:hypothetical protein Trco_000200 [Trichoderma cornu-damae]|uniref:Uncharacterized protein n=1 Tax=Trichoderma cornu-damae TaxID=654480 RepID=A0A9P8QRH8_9HYPO|nr:hypothetical protein Trco_000200 [Trichoderma cornu-damae]
MSGQPPGVNPQYLPQPHPQPHHHSNMLNRPFPSIISASMRDRQARGKDAYGKSDEENTEADEEANRLVAGKGSKAEAFETRERRAYALAVLDRPEQLMMYAQTTNDSIASQRQRFTAMLCGYDEETDWRNNIHYKTTMAAAQARQQKLRRSMNVDRRAG